jgi:hypothetical protein
MNLFEKLFERSKNNRELISIREYDSGDNFWCGIVVEYNKEMVGFEHYTKDATYDGVIYIMVEDIESLDFNNEYTKNLKLLIQRAESYASNELEPFGIEGIVNTKFDILKRVGTDNNIVEIGFDGYDISGFIIEIDENHIEIQPIEASGNKDGSSIYKIEDISTIAFDTNYTRKIKFPYDHKHDTSSDNINQ